MGGGMGLSKKVQVWYCKRKKQGEVGGGVAGRIVLELQVWQIKKVLVLVKLSVKTLPTPVRR